MKYQILLDNTVVGEAETAEAAREFVRDAAKANQDRTLVFKLEIKPV